MAEMKKNTVHELEITGYTAEGAGVGRLEGLVVFVPGTIRGELWRVLLIKVNKNVAWGKGEQLLKAAPCRVEGDCPHAGKCGGCQYRHMDYQEELFAKGQRVEDALRKLAGVTTQLPAVMGAADPLRYRNKVQFPVAVSSEGGVDIGFFRARSHDVIDVEDCLLQPLGAARIRAAVKEWMARRGVLPYREEDASGLLRHLYLRFNSKGEALCCLVCNGKHLPFEEELVRDLRQAEPGLVGVVLNTNKEETNVILGHRYNTLWGQAYLEEAVCGFTFRLSVPSFFQVNRAQTEVLYDMVVDFAGLTGGETVVDLYCGIGTISLCLARRAGQVIGAEIVPQAVQDAQDNAKRNGVENVRYLCGDAGEVAKALEEEGVRPQVVCVDPPRKGLAPEVPEIVAAMAPQRIVYVSCDPATLARDVKRFADLGYTFIKGQGVDLFPRTVHVETVVLLERAPKD